MPSNTNRRFVFFIDADRFEQLAKKFPDEDKNKFAKKIIEDYIDGVLPTLAKPDADIKKIKFADSTLSAWKKAREMGLDIDSFLNLINGSLDSLSASQPAYIQNAEPKPVKILQTDGRYKCLHCGEVLIHKAHYSESPEEGYRSHVEINHGKLYRIEEEQLAELVGT